MSGHRYEPFLRKELASLDRSDGNQGCPLCGYDGLWPLSTGLWPNVKADDRGEQISQELVDFIIDKIHEGNI